MTANTLDTVAATLTDTAIALRDAGTATGKAQIAFARSTVASVLAGVGTLAFAESRLIAIFGGPKDAKGKPVKSASGLRDVEGGFPAYQAFRAIRYVVENVDADKAEIVGDDVVGDGAIRALLTEFALGGGDVRGLSGLKGKVDALMTAHNDAVAKASGIEPAADDKADDKPATLATLDTVRDMAAKLALALAALSDDDFLAAGDAVQAMVDAHDARLNAIADAKVAVAA